MGEKQPQHVICRCQHCNGGIEFDATGLDKAGTLSTECPHCKLETPLYVPPPAVMPEKSQKTSLRQKLASPKTVIILWIASAILLVAALSISGDSKFSNPVGLAAVGCLIAAVIATGNYRSQKNRLNSPKPNYICTHCGTLLTWLSKTPPGKDDLCSECRTNSVVPLGTPRGQELFATYHGKVTARERVEIGDEATRKLLRTLEPFPASGSIANELEKLAALVKIGALTTDDWQRAKNLYLGQPEGKNRQHALARIRELHDLQQSGAVSESEFNAVKWDILSRGVV
ncbi:MAG: hypothetical protein P4N60_21975 [Verrucomicrobiae bacterium]|nr:hypothetical protein [Verrucomicrobiae bacterium]